MAISNNIHGQNNSCYSVPIFRGHPVYWWHWRMSSVKRLARKPGILRRDAQWIPWHWTGSKILYQFWGEVGGKGGRWGNGTFSWLKLTNKFVFWQTKSITSLKDILCSFNITTDRRPQLTFPVAIHILLSELSGKRSKIKNQDLALQFTARMKILTTLQQH